MAKRYDLALPEDIEQEQLIPSLNEKLRLIDNILGKLSSAQQATPTSSQANGVHTVRVNLLPTRLDAGTLFWETDRTALYEVQQEGAARVWVYRLGTMRGTLANIPTLGSNDTGFLFYATDYQHTFRWDGAAWAFAPGDEGSAFFRDFAIAPAGSGWVLANGVATTYVTSDATTHAITPPDLTTGAYRRGGAVYSGTVNAAGAGAIAGNTGDTSGGTPAGTNSAPAFTGSAGTTGATAPTFTGSAMGTHQHTESIAILNAGLTISFGSSPFGTGSSINVTHAVDGYSDIGSSAGDLTSAVSAGTPAGTVSSHDHSFTPAGTVAAPAFTGAALAAHHHDMSGATLTFATAPVKNIEVLVYFRR